MVECQAMAAPLGLTPQHLESPSGASLRTIRRNASSQASLCDLASRCELDAPGSPTKTMSKARSKPSDLNLAALACDDASPQVKRRRSSIAWNDLTIRKLIGE